MNPPNECDDEPGAGNPEVPDSDPICKPVGLAFGPAHEGQAQLMGLASISAPSDDECCPIIIASTNPQLLAVQPIIVIAPGQTTAAVHAVVASPSAAFAATKSRPQSVAYVVAASGSNVSPFARVAIPGAHAPERSGAEGESLPAVQKLDFPALAPGQTSVTGTVTLDKASRQDTSVSVSSNKLQVFSPQQLVTVKAGKTTADVPVLIAPPTEVTPVLAFASIGNDVPVSTLVTVPAQQ